MKPFQLLFEFSGTFLRSNPAASMFNSTAVYIGVLPSGGFFFKAAS